jgi:integration host factor subunit alpha
MSTAKEMNVSISAPRQTPPTAVLSSARAAHGVALTRLDIADAVCDRCEGLSRREAKRLVDGVIEEVTSTLMRGENVKLHDFGSFVVRFKNERKGRNPRTGAKVPIESRRVVVFKASPNMKSLVNGGGTAKSRRGRAAARGFEGGPMRAAEIAPAACKL